MIKGFEKETAELNDYERTTLLPLVVDALSNAIGKQKAVKSGEIVFHLKNSGHNNDSARIRKIVHEIRMKGYIKNLMATSQGYFIAETKKEIDTYIQSLRQRENSIKEIRSALITQSILIA